MAQRYTFVAGMKIPCPPRADEKKKPEPKAAPVIDIADPKPEDPAPEPEVEDKPAPKARKRRSKASED